MEIKEETQTFCEYICVKDYLAKEWVQGHIFYFHEDQTVRSEYFLPVIDSEGYPATKTVRIDK